MAAGASLDEQEALKERAKVLALHRLGVEEAPRRGRVCGDHRDKDPGCVGRGGDREQRKVDGARALLGDEGWPLSPEEMQRDGYQQYESNGRLSSTRKQG